MRIAVIGGGAAGYFGAITAARANDAARVTVLEATDTPLDKVRISGGGRCNVTHHCFEPSDLVRNYPRGHRELRGPFSRFQPRDVVEFFEQRGVTLKTEADGRMFPVTDSSATIIDCLQRTADQAGVTVRLNARVSDIAVRESGDGRYFEVSIHDQAPLRADRVLLATGSSRQGYRIAASLGHTVVPCVPSLFTFKLTDPRIADLSGMSFADVELSLRFADSTELRQRGPMLITHWGLSGPAILKLSAWGARQLNEHRYRAELVVNFVPDYTLDRLRSFLSEYREQKLKRRAKNHSSVNLPLRYWQRLCASVGVSDDLTWANLSKRQLLALADELHAARFDVVGKGIFKEEFVTCGGVALKEVDFKTMQSRICPGLYFAGELLDIDGITGGFNFQSAWTTGWIAGSDMATAPQT